jgi:tubulin-specific chaperone E
MDSLSTIFPGLTSLRISHNPLFRQLTAPDGRILSADDGYMLTIARLAGLKTLNYSPVSEKDCLNAETYYLSLIASEVRLAPQGSSVESILASHPRYAALCAEYGEPDIKRDTGDANAVHPNSLAARLLRIRFCVSSPLGLTGGFAPQPRLQEWEAELPKSLSIYTVLGVVGKYFGIPPPTLRLVWETGEWDFAAGKDEAHEDAEWDSEDDGEDGVERWHEGRTKREVELVPGTRSVGTWVDGNAVDIRVDLIRPG